jgi:hypothetical protein
MDRRVDAAGHGEGRQSEEREGSRVAEEEVVVARIVGRELQVERYEFRQRSVSSMSCAEGELEEQIRRLRPHLVMWSAPDERGRRLAEELQKSDPETQWRPGCVELAGWTHLPFSELLRLMCHVGQNEGGWPPEAEGADGRGAEEAEREDLAEIRQEEQARQAEVAAGEEGETARAEVAEAAEAEEAVSAEAEEAVSAETVEVAEAVEVAEEEQPVGSGTEVPKQREAVSAEAGDVSGEAAQEEEGADQKRDELGQRLELVLAVRARRRERDPG